MRQTRLIRTSTDRLAPPQAGVGIRINGSRVAKDSCGRFCLGQGRVHRRCEVCGDDTCAWGIEVDPTTLRRRRVYVCETRCRNTERYLHMFPRSARTERTLRDYVEVTDGLRTDLVVPEMTDQFPAESRQALRAFMESGETRATVIGSTATSLNQVIAGLGLTGEVFAETRGNTAVLRRVNRSNVEEP